VGAVGSTVTVLPVAFVEGSVGPVFLVVFSDGPVGASVEGSVGPVFLVVFSDGSVGTFLVVSVLGATVSLVVGASVGASVGGSAFPTAADDTILATEISPTRTKTKVFLLQTILLFGNVVSSF